MKYRIGIVKKDIMPVNYFRLGQCLAGAWSALACEAGVADVIYDAPIATEFAAADAVVEARIVGIAGSCLSGKCGNSFYEINTSRIIFEDAPAGRSALTTNVAVCAQSRLGLGQTFVFMLHHVKNVGVDDPSTPIDESVGKCAYYANFGAVFLQYTATSYFRYGSPEASTLVREGGALYLTIGKEQEGLIDELNRLAEGRKKKVNNPK